MKVVSLCTGYGGLELALRAAGIEHELAYVADPDPAAAAVLAARFPGVPNLGDIRNVDWQTVVRPDLLTAGFPCQDISCAGLGAGIAAGTRSGVWLEVVRAIASLHPALVWIENVRGLLSARAHSDVEPCPWCLGDRGGDDQEPVLRALGAVLGDLSDLGYDAEWITVAASDVGAAHQRERVFLVAYPANAEGLRYRYAWAQGGQRIPAATIAGGPTSFLPTPGARLGKSDRWGQYADAIARWEHILGRPAPGPTEPNKSAAVRLSARFVEWLMGLPEGWVCDVPGLSRNDMLRLLGNGVVPDQAAHALHMLAGR